MPCGSKGRAASTQTQTNCNHGEVEALCCDALEYEVVKVPQQGIWSRLAFELMQCFGVNAVGQECRTDAMARHVAHEDGQNLVAVWKNHAEITANGARGTIVGRDRDIVPHQALWRERLLNTSSE